MDPVATQLTKVISQGEEIDLRVFDLTESPLIDSDGNVVFSATGRTTEEGVTVPRDGLWYYDNESEPLIAIALSGRPAPAPASGEDPEFGQVFSWTFQGLSVRFNAVAGPKEGIWVWSTTSGPVLLVEEGQDWEALEPPWHAPGLPMLIAGSTESAYTLLELDSVNLGTGREISGIWLNDFGEHKLVAITPAPLLRPPTPKESPPGTDFVFRSFSGSTLNAAGDVAFVATLVDHVEPLRVAGVGIWKKPLNGNIVRVVEVGDPAPLEIFAADIDAVFSPVMSSDGRVVFGSTMQDDEFNRVAAVLVEGPNGLEVIARTDQLPGSTREPLLAPYNLERIAVNRFGHVAFTVERGNGLWAQDPNGVLTKIAEVGDKLELDTTDGKVTKTLSSVGFGYLSAISGVNTESGRPTGYSDDHNLAFRAEFTDGTEAVMLATFDPE